MYLHVSNLCQELINEWDLIPVERKSQLRQLSDYISRKIQEDTSVHLIVICTHNSRRSHMGQIWLSVAADYYGLDGIRTYSGGTEATAFNIRAVEAFRKLGFRITVSESDNDNHRYGILWSDNMNSSIAFSKRYDASPNPTENFGAIMVCTQADEGCPIIAGADFRLSLPYEDPKAYDYTELETEKYSERTRQIGREMLYAISLAVALI